MPGPNVSTVPPKPKFRTGLTDARIDGLPVTGKKYDVPDRNCRGLVLTVTPAGGKSFRWHVRSLGRAITLGPWSPSTAPGHLTLAEARRWLIDLKAARRGGALDAKEAELRAHLGRPSRGQAIARPGGLTVAEVAEEFYRTVLSKRKRPIEARKMLDDQVLVEGFGSRPIKEVKAPEIGAVVKAYVASGAPARAGKLLGLIKHLFKHAEGNGYVEDNRARALAPGALGIVVGKGTRCLDAPKLPHRGEIKALWLALDAGSGPVRVERPDPRTGKVQVYEQRFPSLAPATRAAAKLLLLTGVRSGELLRARWEDVDLDTAEWVIPVSNQKLTRKQEPSAFPWRVPLTPTAITLFRELKALAEKVPVPGGKTSPWVMASPGAASGRYDDRSLSHALRRFQSGPNGLKLPGGVVKPHDLRRTMRTHLGVLRVPRDVRERCLNHALGKIEDTYDVGDYFDERREALEKWDAYVMGLVNPRAAQVIPLPSPAASGA